VLTRLAEDCALLNITFNDSIKQCQEDVDDGVIDHDTLEAVFRDKLTKLFKQNKWLWLDIKGIVPVLIQGGEFFLERANKSLKDISPIAIFDTMLALYVQYGGDITSLDPHVVRFNEVRAHNEKYKPS